MNTKHITAMPKDLVMARTQLGHVRATLSQLLDDPDIATGKTWKRLNKIYQALDSADREMSRAQDQLAEIQPKLQKQFEVANG